MNKKHIINGGIVIVAIIIIGLFIVNRKAVAPTEPVPPATVNEMETYTSANYGVMFEYPKDWQVYESTSTPGGFPVINVYKKSETQKPPFTHHSTVTQVGFFPKGVPTEGAIGKTSTSSKALFKELVKSGFDYVTLSGDRYATFATFQNPPLGWDDFGFIWARAEVPNEKMKCVDSSGKELPENNCGMGVEYSGQSVLTGTVNQKDREITDRILKSIIFLPKGS